jgi:hypothetical protein
MSGSTVTASNPYASNAGLLGNSVLNDPTLLAQASTGKSAPAANRKADSSGMAIKTITEKNARTQQAQTGTLKAGRTATGTLQFWLEGSNGKRYALTDPATKKPLTNAVDAETRARQMIAGGAATALSGISKAPTAAPPAVLKIDLEDPAINSKASGAGGMFNSGLLSGVLPASTSDVAVAIAKNNGLEVNWQKTPSKDWNSKAKISARVDMPNTETGGRIYARMNMEEVGVSGSQGTLKIPAGASAAFVNGYNEEAKRLGGQQIAQVVGVLVSGRAGARGSKGGIPTPAAVPNGARVRPAATTAGRSNPVTVVATGAPRSAPSNTVTTENGAVVRMPSEAMRAPNIGTTPNRTVEPAPSTAARRPGTPAERTTAQGTAAEGTTAKGTTAKGGTSATSSNVNVAGSKIEKALSNIETITEGMSDVGTVAGLAYLTAKMKRGEVEVTTADKLPGLGVPVSTLFNTSSASNSVSELQSQVVIYTTKPGSKQADGYFVATATATAGGSKIFNVAKMQKDLAAGKGNSEWTSWLDFGKINAIAQNIASKKQTGGGIRGTALTLPSASVGMFFGIPQLNTRTRLDVNLAAMNVTLRGMKQNKGGKIEAAALLQLYANVYTALPLSKKGPLEPRFKSMQVQLQKQLGLPMGTSISISKVQPAKGEANAWINQKREDGSIQRVRRERTGKGFEPTGAMTFTLNGNRMNTNNGKFMEQLAKGKFSEAMGTVGKDFKEGAQEINSFGKAMMRSFEPVQRKGP